MSLVQPSIAHPTSRHPRDVVITPRSARLGIHTFIELWEYREVLSAFTKRHVKVKYKQMLLGMAWAIFQPLIMTLILSTFLGRVLAARGATKLATTEGLPLVPFVLAGMVLWNNFSTSVSYGMDSLVREAGLLRKIYFPREILPISSVISFCLDLSLNMLVLFAVLVFNHLPLHWTMLLLPIPVALTVLAANAVATAFSALNVYYRDMRQILPFIIQLGLIASPVMYSPEKNVLHLSREWQAVYLVANPMAEAIDSFRKIMLHGVQPDWGLLGFAWLWVLTLTALALTLFKRIEKSFVDRV